MPDKVKILYNGTDAFDPQPTPFVGLEENNIYYGEYWAKQEEITLEGQLTGCTFEDIVTAQQALIEKFKKNFQSLEIWQEEGGISGKIFQKDLVEIQSIVFPSDRWIGVLPYTVTLSCYPSGYFSGAFGILDPIETWDIQENDNFSANITHTLSCRGINTSNSISNALENAKQWVFGKTGVESFIAPAFVQNISTGNFCLLTSSEEIDRFNGRYSLTNNYTTDQARNGYGIARYSADISSGNNLISVSLQGSVEGCGGNISGARVVFQNLDKTGSAAFLYRKTFDRTDLNPIPLNFSIDEDPYNATINFSYAFDNDNSPETYFDYTVSLNSGESITASLNGDIISRGGDLKSKMEKSKSYLTGSLNHPYNLVVPFYNDFYPYFNQFPLNPSPISSGISVNEANGSISLNVEFSNQEQVSNWLESFEYTINFTPSIFQIDSRPIVNGLGIYSLVSLGFGNRPRLSINGSSKIKEDIDYENGVMAIKTKAEEVFANYGKTANAVLEVNSIQSSRYDQKLVSFNFEWSFDGDINNPNFDVLTTLTV